MQSMLQTQCVLSQIYALHLFCLKVFLVMHLKYVCCRCRADYPPHAVSSAGSISVAVMDMINRRYRGPITALISAAAIALCGF